MPSAGRFLGYARLRITHLLREEAASGSAIGNVIAAALDAKRTVPLPATLAVIRKAIADSPARRFLLDGYPRVVSDGYPTVQDQVRLLVGLGGSHLPFWSWKVMLLAGWLAGWLACCFRGY